MTQSDEQLIENSREINHARQIIAKDLTQLKQKLDAKKINADIHCWIYADGSLCIYVNANGYTRPFNGQSYLFARSKDNYDEAFNKAIDQIINAEGDISVECQPWFDMKVYDESKEQNSNDGMFGMPLEHRLNLLADEQSHKKND